MRVLAILLAAAGLVLGLALPLAGIASWLPLLAAVCFLAAGFVGAGAVRRRGGWLALAGVLAAAAVIALPVIVNRIGNAKGIAWSVGDRENVEFAEAGMAITAMDGSTVLTGRDLDDGERRWRLDLGKPLQPRGQLRIQRVGRTVLVTGRDGVLRAVDLGTGKVRWKTPSAPFVLASVANPEFVAVTRCGDNDTCVVEARALRDGAVRWASPLVLDGAFLGSPAGGEQLQDPAKLWPASVVIVRLPPQGKRYEVRELATGRVISRASTGRDLLAVTGNRFLRATEDGALSATDVGGREAWTRPSDGLFAVRAESMRSNWLAMPDGGIVLLERLGSQPLISVRGTYRQLDPRTGRVSEHPLDLPSTTVEVFPGPGPDVTAETATTGVAPRVPVMQAVRPGDPPLLIDGRRIDPGDIDFRSIEVTDRQVGWERPLKSFGRGEREGIEVIDRTTGQRLVRYVADEVRVREVGERLVIGDGDGEDGEDREYVVDAG
jgi:hypothetical protein